MANDMQNAPAGAENGVEARLAQLEQLVGAHNEFLKGNIQEQEAAKQQQAEQEAAAQAEAEQQAKLGKMRDSFAQYPDQDNLRGAVEHLGGAHAAAMRDYGVSDDDIQASVIDGLKQIGEAALQNGLSPAHAIYQYALQNGYKPQEAKQMAEAGAEAVGQQDPADTIPQTAEGEPTNEPQAEEAAQAAGAEPQAEQPAIPEKGFVAAVKGNKTPKSGGAGKGGFDAKAAANARNSGDLEGFARMLAN